MHRVLNFTAGQIAQGTMSKVLLDVDDSGTETVEAIRGKRMEHMTLFKEDIARPTSNRYADLPLELNLQELAGMMDATWGVYYMPEKKAPPEDSEDHTPNRVERLDLSKLDCGNTWGKSRKSADGFERLEPSRLDRFKSTLKYNTLILS